MPKIDQRVPEDFIMPLNMNGLEGRMLRLPAQKANQPEILFIYGQHSSLERWWGIALELNKLGAITMPDLPGLGGMNSLYKIGKPATIDNMADYLAAFIKLKYRNKKFILVGMSLGFVVATRMLQKYPELSKKITLLASIVGFVHADDFLFSKRRLKFYKIASIIFSRRLPALFFRYVLLSPLVLRTVYHRTRHAKEKFEQASGDEFKRTMDMEIELWHINDVRTQFKNYLEMFDLDNTGTRIELPVHHVAAHKDRYFNNVKVEEHMRRVFSDFYMYYTKAPNHAPTIIATAKDAAPFMPVALRRQIKKA